MNKYLKELDNYLKRSNPSFTEYSLKRTLEVIILRIDGRGFMDKVDSTLVDSLLKISKESNPEISIRYN